MSAGAVGEHMPSIITLDDLAAMITGDPYGHRYETSPEGALSVMPPPDSEHAASASRLFAWLILAGRPAEQVLHAAGVSVAGPPDRAARPHDHCLSLRPRPRR